MGNNPLQNRRPRVRSLLPLPSNETQCVLKGCTGFFLFFSTFLLLSYSSLFLIFSFEPTNSYLFFQGGMVMRLCNVEFEMDDLLREKMDEFLFLKQTQGRERRTIDDYRKEFDKFYSKSRKKLDSGILREDCVLYFSTIPTTSSAVFNRPYSCLNAFFNYCVRQDYLDYNPFVKAEITKKRDSSKVSAVSLEDVKKLLNCCDRRSYTGLRNYAIIQLMIDTGIRTSELVRLEDRDFQKDRIVIRSEICKIHQSRILYLSSSTSSAIGKVIKVKPEGWSKYLFASREGNRLDTNELSREFRKLCVKGNIKITPYQLRHTFATICVENGINVFLLQQLMGHSDIAMTKRYTDISQQQLQEAHNQFSPKIKQQYL